MAEPQRRGRRRANDNRTEKSIGEAALRRFADAGFDGSSLRDIAAEAGVDVALVSYRFGSKLDLWKAIVERVGATMVERLRGVAQTETTDAGSALATAMNALIDINCDDDAIPRVLLRDASHDPERAAWVFDHVSRPVLDEFLPLIERAMAEGAVTAPIPALFFLNFAYGLAGHVIRRATLARLAPELADEAAFRAALRVTLVEPHFRRG